MFPKGAHPGRRATLDIGLRHEHCCMQGQNRSLRKTHMADTASRQNTSRPNVLRRLLLRHQLRGCNPGYPVCTPAPSPL